MKFRKIARNLVLAGLLTAPLAAPMTASAQYHYDRDGRAYSYDRDGRRYYHHYRTCGADRRRRANNGTAIGAVTGGVLGSALGGGKFGNVLLGAGAGAVAGHAVGKSTAHC